jgi:hypothetical protein
MEGRDLYLREGLAYIPRILELADTNRLSPTYGCFDRSYWHYRTSDFPSGMYQEAVLPLALAYRIDHATNPFCGRARLGELVLAGIGFAAKSSHSDGSCDDYYPFERAAGASAFSLYAGTEACLLLGIKEKVFLAFFARRARYLAREGFHEAGILSNHKALIVLALYNVYLLTRDEAFKQEAGEKRDALLRLQKGEGWFPEYEGCDPGYLNFTIDFLAKYFVKSGDEKVLEPIRKAIRFNSFFMHPDGSAGGEYGSRNTFHFLPHGFELMGPLTPEAHPMADLFLEALEGKRRSLLDDDRIFCHYVYNFLQAHLDFSPRRVTKKLRGGEAFTEIFREARLVAKSRGEYYTVISLGKGGVAKCFKGKELVYSDCGFLGKTTDGKTFISQVFGDFACQVSDERVSVEGTCFEAKDLYFPTPLFLLLHAVMWCFGRFLPGNVMRRLIVKLAIVKKKKKFPLRFRKRFVFGEKMSVECSFTLEAPGIRLAELWIPADASFIYVATSRPYQAGMLRDWMNLGFLLPELNEKRSAEFRRVIA